MSDLNLRIIIGAVTDGALRGIDEVQSRLGSMGSSLKATFTSIYSVIAVAVTGALVQGAISIARGFDVINASIKTATRGLQDQAIPAIKEFAAKTPFDLEQVSNAFVKLVNFGLDPSERALRSYGNTSTALGKDLSQMVEAVADATTGEFERLKEFGIKSKVQGDQVTFTFQGVKTTVKNNAQEIEQYLIRLGEVNFAGAMEDRAKSLDGALSNLGDSWRNLVGSIMQAGLSEVVAESARSATESLDSIRAFIEAGGIQTSIRSITTAVDGMASDVSNTMSVLSTFIEEQFRRWEVSGSSTASYLTTEFQAWLNNTRSFIKIVTVESASFWDKIGTLTDSSLNSMRRPMEAQNEQIDIINQARKDSITAILDEHNAQKQATADAIRNSEKLLQQLNREAEAHKAAASGDRLAKFKLETPGGSSGASTSGGSKSHAKAPHVPEESEIHAFERALAERKAAYEKEDALREFSKEQEKAYWDEIIATYSGNSKTLADLKKKSADLELAIVRDKAKEQLELTQAAQEEEFNAANDALELKRQDAEYQLSIGAITQQQLLEQQRAFEEERYQIALKYAQQKRDLIVDDVAAVARAENAITALKRDHAAKQIDIEQQITIQKKRELAEQFGPLENALDQSVNGILTGQQTLANAVRNAAQSIVVSYTASFLKQRAIAAAEWAWEVSGFDGKEARKRAIEQAGTVWRAAQWLRQKVVLAGQWLWEVLGFTHKETAKTGVKAANEGTQVAITTTAEGAKTAAVATGELTRVGVTLAADATTKASKSSTAKANIMSYAAEAAAAAYNSLASIPYVGWILGAIAAAVTFAAVAGYSAYVGSAKGGEWEVGQDGSPYILHEKESVLPAGVAENFRKVVGIVQQHTGGGLASNGTVLPGNTGDLVKNLMATGRIAPQITLPQHALAVSNQAKTLGAALRDSTAPDSAAPIARHAGKQEVTVNMNGILLSPEQFFEKHGKTLVDVANQQARKFHTVKKK